MITISILDDNPVHLKYIESLTTELMSEPSSIRSFTEGHELIQAFSCGEQFDIAILDIVLDKLNGIDIAAEINRCSPRTVIIFVSGGRDFSPNLYEADHIYFLKKPLVKEDLVKALRKALGIIKDNYIVLSLKNSVKKIFLDDILYLENSGRKSIIYLEQETLEYGKNLKTIEPLLPKLRFIRCHNSFIVNLQKVTEVNRKNMLFRNGASVPISRRYLPEIKSRIEEYLLRGDSI